MNSAEGVGHAVALELPLVAVAGGKREQRRAPVPEDGDAHVMAEPRRASVMFGAHECYVMPCPVVRVVRAYFAPRPRPRGLAWRRCGRRL